MIITVFRVDYDYAFMKSIFLSLSLLKLKKTTNSICALVHLDNNHFPSAAAIHKYLCKFTTGQQANIAICVRVM